jgi:succinate dehydrogenase / fumarate reductase flavoprotein subunit
VVFGRRAGEAAAVFSSQCELQRRSRAAVEAANAALDELIKPGSELARPLQRALRNLMWEHCGVVRNEASLRQGLGALGKVREAAQAVDVRPGQEGWSEVAHTFDLRAGLLAAEATLLGALRRCESRGAHQRSEFPETDSNQKVNHWVRWDPSGGQLEVGSAAVPPVPPRLAQWADEARQMEVAGDRLLE